MRTSEIPLFEGGDFDGAIIATVEVTPSVFRLRRVPQAAITQGPTGPTGPAGLAGPTGPTGSTGAPGTNGTNGTNGAVGPPGPGSEPGGIDKEVQFNDAGIFQGDAGLTYDKATNSLTVGGTVAAFSLTGNGASITDLVAENIATGTVASARLGTGSGGATKFLREDQTWQEPAASIAPTFGTVAYAATTNINFDGDDYQEVSLTGNVTFTTSNLAAAKSVAVIIISDGSTRTFTFPAGWKFLNASGVPASIVANKTAVLSLLSRTGADSGVIAAYSVQP